MTSSFTPLQINCYHLLYTATMPTMYIFFTPHRLCVLPLFYSIFLSFSSFSLLLSLPVFPLFSSFLSLHLGPILPWVQPSSRSPLKSKDSGKALKLYGESLGTTCRFSSSAASRPADLWLMTRIYLICNQTLPLPHFSGTRLVFSGQGLNKGNIVLAS